MQIQNNSDYDLSLPWEREHTTWWGGSELRDDELLDRVEAGMRIIDEKEMQARDWECEGWSLGSRGQNARL